MNKNIAIVVAALGWVLWVAFLVTPVVVIEKGRFLGLQSAPEIVARGWDVVRAALHGVPGLWDDPEDVFSVLLSLGNAVMLITPFALFTRAARLRRVVTLLVVAETLAIAAVYVVTQGWTWSGPGYWLWLLSFVLVSASLTQARRLSKQEPVPEPTG